MTEIDEAALLGDENEFTGHVDEKDLLDMEGEINEIKEEDLYDEAIEPTNVSIQDIKPVVANTNTATSTTSYKDRDGKKFCAYVGNLTWWTTDIDIMIALAACDIAKEDFTDVKFFENRTNGQSKGYALVVLNTEAAQKELMAKMPNQIIHNQKVTVYAYNKTSLAKLEEIASRNGGRVDTKKKEDPNLGTFRIGGSGPPPLMSLPQRPPASFVSNNSNNRYGGTNFNGGMRNGPPVLTQQIPMGPGPVQQVPNPLGPGTMPATSLMPQTRLQINGQPILNQGPMPLMQQQVQPPQQQGPPPLMGAPTMQPPPATIRTNLIPNQPQPLMQQLTQPLMVNAPPPQQQQPYGLPMQQAPQVQQRPPMQAPYMQQQPQQAPQPLMSVQHQPPSLMTMNTARPPMQSMHINPQMYPNMHPGMGGYDYEETMTRNQTVATSATSRAMSDVAQNDFKSATETLLTAIRLLRESGVDNDERCRRLISSLEDTLRMVDAKSISVRSGKSHRDRSRSRERKRRRRSYSRSNSRSPSPHRSRRRY